MQGNESRRHLPPEKKFEVVKEVIMGKAPVSEVCKRHEVSPGLYYKWQQVFFNEALEELRHHKKERGNCIEEKLRAENQRLKEVISELAGENLQLKKVLGNNRACGG